MFLSKILRIIRFHAQLYLTHLFAIAHSYGLICSSVTKIFIRRLTAVSKK